ncbi:MAG: NAD(P)-dependent alcohol dehydrogenase [Nocardioides sp.]|nr:NAD(P)-dependent alcohol dehydrogenase [Nocardioides sp.]
MTTTTGTTTTATAAVLRGQDDDFTFEQITLGALQPGEILVRTTATGLCHTDLAVQHGHIPSPFPVVLGHEGAGVVEQVGPDVTEFAVGDRVAVSFTSCGHCDACRSGRAAYCESFMALNIGGAREDGTTTLRSAEDGHDGETVHGSFFGQSSFATAMIASVRNAVKVPDDVPLELVGPLGCGIQTGAGTVLNSLDVRAGESIVVSGTGAVGLSGIMAARAAGATTIIAVDILDSRLEMATKLGATHTINSTREDVVETVQAATGGVGAMHALDTTGIPAVIETVMNATRFGATTAAVGVGKPDAVLPQGLVSGAGRNLIGAIEGDAVPQVFIPRLLDLYRAGLFPFDQLITTYPFAELEQAIADTQSGAAVKAVLTM